MIGYYKKYIWSLRPEAYKGILEGILSTKYPRLTESQKKAVREYFEFSKNIYSHEAQQYQGYVDRLK